MKTLKESEAYNSANTMIYIFIFICTFCLSSCSSKNEKTVPKEKTATVSITGISKYPSIKGVSLISQIPYDSTNLKFDRFHSMIRENDTFWANIDCDTHLSLHITSVNAHPQNIFLTAGDSVSFTIDTLPPFEYSILRRIIFIFSGKNSAHYNYDYLRQSQIKENIYYKKGDNIIDYKNKISKYRAAQLKFLDDYASKYSISSEFRNYAESNINNDYIIKLYNPVNRKLILKEDLPINYFDENISPSNDITTSYRWAMEAKYITPHTENICEDIDSMRNYVLNNFKGDDKDFLYSLVIELCSAEASGTNTTLEKMFKEAPLHVTNRKCLRYINLLKEKYNPLNMGISMYNQQKTLVKSFSDNKTYTLEDVLKLYKGKALYLDFWASWCRPCLSDIRNSSEIKKLLNENNIEYLYFAIRDYEDSWRKAVNSNNIGHNQYLIIDSNESPLVQYYDIIEIPRYMFLNKKHEITNLKAPRPIVEMKDKIQQNINIALRE